MQNIFNYIKNFGHLSFEEEPFNDVDNLVFASLSYVDYNQNFMLSHSRVTIEETANDYFLNHDKKLISKNITAVRQAIKILGEIKDTKRYKSIFITNYIYVGDKSIQFCAMTFEIKKNLYYVSFEGTDHLISGWKEDFQMAYMFPVPAQKMAIDYLNKTIKKIGAKYIIGGHSKGGNLAIISSMYCHFWIKNKIIKVYNNDGPGLRKKQIESKNYKNIEKKLSYIIPNYSFVGLLLRHTDNYQVVYSYEKGILAHDLTNWKIEGKSFVPAKLSFLSKELDLIIIKWLDKYNDIERKKFVDSLFDVCTRADINNLIDIKSSKFNNLIKIIKETKNMDQETKRMIIDLFKFILKFCSIDLKNQIFSKKEEL